MQTAVLKVQHLNDQADADALAAALGKLAGIDKVDASAEACRVTIRFDENVLSPEQLLATLNDAGLSVAAQPAADAGAKTCCGGCCG